MTAETCISCYIKGAKVISGCKKCFMVIPLVLQKESFPQRTEIEQMGCSVELQPCLCQDPDLTNEEAQSSGVDGWIFCLYNGCLFKQNRPLLQYFANVSILPPEPIDVWSTLTLSGF
ncbi:hypothetical protein GOODEAATRI_020258 [Goodea atripinnis]|uniref:Uncharacterized protein n=1 Tax=Goodea atripinnis TaxID=208336 RepID=A0ABV0P6E7_9TELE